jgi:hypothetical protein
MKMKKISGLAILGLMMPAFSPAIFANVSPKNWVWSKLMLVMMHKSG